MIEYRPVPGAEDGTESAVVGEDELSRYQSDGWTLVMLMPSQELVAKPTTRRGEAGVQPGTVRTHFERTAGREHAVHVPPHHEVVYKHEFVWTTRYLLRKSRDKVVTAREKLALARNAADAALGDTRDLKQQLEAAERDLIDAQGRIAEKQTALDKATDGLDDAEEARRRMEVDLGKIREHFGSRAVKEALGET